MVGVFVKEKKKLDYGFQLSRSIVMKADNMHILNIGITTHFREVKQVDFLSITQIRNPMGPGK